MIIFRKELTRGSGFSLLSGVLFFRLTVLRGGCSYRIFRGYGLVMLLKLVFRFTELGFQFCMIRSCCVSKLRRQFRFVIL